MRNWNSDGMHAVVPESWVVLRRASARSQDWRQWSPSLSRPRWLTTSTWIEQANGESPGHSWLVARCNNRPRFPGAAVELLQQIIGSHGRRSRPGRCHIVWRMVAFHRIKSFSRLVFSSLPPWATAASFLFSVSRRCLTHPLLLVSEWWGMPLAGPVAF